MKTGTTLIALFAAFVANLVYAAPTVNGAGLERRGAFDTIEEVGNQAQSTFADLGKTGAENFGKDISSAKGPFKKRNFGEDLENDTEKIEDAAEDTGLSRNERRNNDIGVGSTGGTVVSNAGTDIQKATKVVGGVGKAVTGG